MSGVLSKGGEYLIIQGCRNVKISTACLLQVACLLLAVVSPTVDAINVINKIGGPTPLHRCLHTCYIRYQTCTMPCMIRRTKPELVHILCIHLCVRSFVHSFDRSLFFVRSLLRSPVISLVRSLANSLTLLLTQNVIHPLIN